MPLYITYFFVPKPCAMHQIKYRFYNLDKKQFSTLTLLFSMIQEFFLHTNDDENYFLVQCL
jgi:hypothetical protein